MSRFAVCYVDELPPGERRIVEISGRSIGVFRIGDEYFAVRNRCPHKGAPLCLGLQRGLVTSSQRGEYVIEHQDRILACPWHGWEFDLATGASVFNPHKLRVKHYDVSVSDPEPVYDFACATGNGEDPSIETFPISIEVLDESGQEQEHERKMIYVHVA
jgi:nitrite reductase/ring-hydroxylating ferredoxin subunit